MHTSTRLRMKWFMAKYLDVGHGAPLTVLDVGSQDVNGSYRDLFPAPDFRYTGLDMVPGDNVDIVMETPYNWRSIPDASFDVVICGQVFEHTEFFWSTMEEMARVLKPNGLLCVIVPAYQARHRFPVDVYRFNADGMIALARYANLTPLHASSDMAPPDAGKEWYEKYLEDSMLVARKPMDWRGIVDARSYRYVPADVEELATGFVERKTRVLFVPCPDIGEGLSEDVEDVEFARSRRLLEASGCVLFGTGPVGARLLRECRDEGIAVAAFCDNALERIGGYMEGIPVLAPRDAVMRHPDLPFIIATGNEKYVLEMLRQLRDLGCPKIYLAIRKLFWF